MTPKLKNKITIKIVECHGQGISVSVVLDGFKKMKAELEALDCEVSITIWGWPIDAMEFVEAAETELEAVK